MQDRRIRPSEVKRLFGDISNSTLFRFWKQYKILPPPTKFQGRNFWWESDVNRAMESGVQTSAGVV